MRPIDARTHEEICELASDNFPGDVGAFNVLLSENEVSLHLPNQIGWITIPRAEFDDIAIWYTTES